MRGLGALVVSRRAITAGLALLVIAMLLYPGGTAVAAGLVASSSVLMGFLIPADVGPGLHRQLASWGFDIALLVPLYFAIATATDGRFRGGVMAACS